MTPLHGRDPDFARILTELTGGRPVVIRGGPGIGKTELWRNALVAMAERGAPVHRVVATETTRLIPGGVFAGLLAHADPAPGDGDRLVATLRALAALGAHAVLGVDDAHLLDDESAAALLQHALGGGIVLLTARSDEPASDAVTRFWKDALATLLELGPLDAAASGALVEELVAAPVEALTQARIFAASGGNPLLVRELVAHGRASGAFTDLGGMWTWSGALEAGPNVAAVIRERLARLDPAAREVAALLAVGGPLPRTLFERLATGPALSAARRAGILRDRSHGASELVDLAHPLYGPVLAESLPAQRVQTLLERLVAAAEPFAAADRDLGVLLAAWLVRLADRSRPDLLVDAADRAFSRAELGLAGRLARAAIAAGAGDAAVRVTERIAAFLGEEARGPARGQEDARSVLEAALARADGFLVGLASRDAALAALADAQQRIGGAYRLEAAAHALTIRVYAGEAIAPNLSELDPLLAASEHPKVVARAAMAAAPALTLAGRPVDALAVLAKGVAAADASGRFSPYLRDRLVSTGVQCLLFAGRVDDAFVAATRRHAEAEAADDAPALGTWSQVLAQVLLWQGRPREAARRFGEALALMRGIDIVGYGRWCQAELALSLAWAGGDRGDAKLPQIPEPGSHGALLAPLIGLALAARSLCLGEHAEAERCATEVSARAAAGGQTMSELLAEHFLLRLRPTRARGMRVAALAASCQGEYAAAFAQSGDALASGRGTGLERAAQRFAAMGLAPLATEWFLRAATAHRDEGGSAAARRAGNLAQEQRARMEADPPLPAGARAAADPLTPREREVAELAARGLTNHEIARRLAVSVRTVHAHLRTVYDKLGVNERRHLAPMLQRSAAGDPAPPNDA